MGRIGQAVARRARAFGMQIHYHNRKRLRPEVEADLEATYWESLDQMVSRMDVLSINCPHTPSTFHLMNARRLKLMKPSAVIVNTSRGEVIDENALTRMLRAGEIAGAGLDVYEHGTEINPRLRDLPNVVLAAAYGIGDDRGPDRDGRKGHHQHQDLCRRPPPAGSGRAGHVVGHSPGSIGLLDERDGLFFTGDAVYDDRLVDDIPGASVPDYLRTFARLKDLEFRVAHGGHGPSFTKARLAAIASDYFETRG
jgi:hypothetical protein